MYDRHKPIIKWYEYDATKLIKKAEPEVEQIVDDNVDGYNDYSSDTNMVAADQPQASSDPSLDDEVARIMAAFSNAKQNSVDSVFASMNM